MAKQDTETIDSTTATIAVVLLVAVVVGGVLFLLKRGSGAANVPVDERPHQPQARPAKVLPFAQPKAPIPIVREGGPTHDDSELTLDTWETTIDDSGVFESA
jgi:hypothetical protein